MARPLRFQYSGAVYHVMARGNGGEFICEQEEDSRLFLKWLGEVCESHGWKVHAWVLMGNHFHILLETPEANLVSGMRILLGAYAQAWNRRHNRRGHVFQGRYKSIPVSGDRASDGFQFRVLADYIHLNPARAKLAGGRKGPLIDYQWSSLANYQSGRGPSRLVRDRVLKAFELSKDGRGRRAYVRYLEKRADEQKGELSPEATAALRKGWYLGDEAFRDKLLALVENGSRRLKAKGSHKPETIRSFGEKEAERIVALGLELFDLEPVEKEQKDQIRKGDARRVAIATVLKKRTTVGNRWIAEQLQMGHDRSVSRLIKQGEEESNVKKFVRKLEKMLPCEQQPPGADIVRG